MNQETTLSWWQRPVRMMRLDYGPDLQRMRADDLAALAHSKKHDWHINCEWVIGTPGIAPGLGYLTTFASPHFEHYPTLEGWDLIRSYLPHARREGIHVLAYLDMHWFSYEFAATHPEWEQLLADGRPYGNAHPLYGSGTTFCVNSSWRDWAFQMIAEAARTGIDGVFLDGPVVFSGCCYCPTCREQFQEKYGAPIPKEEDWSSPLWKAFIDFREDSMANFLCKARESLHAVNPEGVIFLNAGSWNCGSWRGARNIEKVGEFQDFNGSEVFFHPERNANAPIPWAITAKHLMAGGKPAVVFSHHTLGSWHYIPLAPLEAKMAAAETVACGANPWIAVFDYALDHSREEAIRPINDVFGFLEMNEPYYTATESAAEVAVLHSRQSATFYTSHFENLYEDHGSGSEQNLVVDLGTGKMIVDWKKRKQLSDNISATEFAGWCLALSRQHIPYDVILDGHLSLETLRRYRVVVLPNFACISDTQAQSLCNYVAEGGRIIATFETGCYQSRGELRSESALKALMGYSELDGAFPTASAEEYAQVITSPEGFPFHEGRLLPRSTYAMRVQAVADRTVPVRFLNPTGRLYAALQSVSPYAAEIRGQVGRGRVVYLPQALGEAYYRNHIAEAEQWMTAAVRWAYETTQPVTVTAPPTVQVEVRRQERRLLVHLVNHNGDTQRPYQYLSPVTGITLVVQGQTARSAFMLRSKAQLQAELAGEGAWRYCLPEIAEYDVAVLNM